MTVTVYSKPACVQCTATTRALDARGIAYQLVDLTQDAVAMAQVLAAEEGLDPRQPAGGQGRRPAAPLCARQHGLGRRA